MFQNKESTLEMTIKLHLKSKNHFHFTHHVILIVVVIVVLYFLIINNGKLRFIQGPDVPFINKKYCL